MEYPSSPNLVYLSPSFNSNFKWYTIKTDNFNVHYHKEIEEIALSGANIAEQTQSILDQIDGLLAEVGTDKTKILSATIWLCSMDDFGDMNKVWDAWISKGQAPCRACVESARLASPDFLVEVGITAAK